MSDSPELTDDEKNVVSRMADAEMRGDLPPGGAMRVAYAYIMNMRLLAESRGTVLSQIGK